MNVLIIGGTQLSGPHIVTALVRQGHHVTVFHRGHSMLTPLPPDAREILDGKANLAGHQSEFEALKPDMILHMVAVTREDAHSFVDTFRGIAGRAIVISSADVYLAYGRLRLSEPGPPEPVPLAESAPVRTKLSPEGEVYDKVGVEQIVREEASLNATIIRYPAIFGPGDYQHRFHRYLSRMKAEDRVLQLSESAASFRFAHAYSEDVAHAVVLAITNAGSAGHIYNVAELETPITLERVKRLATAIRWPGTIDVLPDDHLPPETPFPVDYRQQYTLDSSLIRRELGYAEVVSEQEALRRTATWELANPPPAPVAP